jgi:hypothetical protein
VPLELAGAIGVGLVMGLCVAAAIEAGRSWQHRRALSEAVSVDPHLTPRSR